MADKSISELTKVNKILPTDLFVTEQDGIAKKVTGQDFESWLLSFADGHGGIQSIVKINTNGLVDTYRITLADTTITDFTVTNGRGIKGIAKTNTQSLNDTYTITYTDGTSSTFTVTNGAKGDKGDNTYTWIKYASKDPKEPPHSMGDIPDRYLGIYWGPKSSAPTLWSEYRWYEIKGVKGDIGDPATIVSTSTVYQTSTSGTVIPSGSWLKNPPAVPQGRFLWTRTTTQFNSGNPVVSYGVSYVGKDGKGQVESVNGQTGIVDLKASDIGAIPNSFVPEEVPPENTLDIIQDAGRLLAKGAVKIEKLWENASPNSGFAPQEINIDLTNWASLAIEFKISAEHNGFKTWLFPKGSNTPLEAPYLGITFFIPRSNFFFSREILKTDNSGVTFGEGYQGKISGEGFTKANQNAIPVAIFGIKGVN